MRPTWRTVLIAVLASVLIAPSLFAQTLTVKVQRGNVRSGPGKSYPVIGRVQKADNFPIEARQGDWFKILLETGREGWVFKSLVEVSGKRSIGVVPSGPAPSASRPYGDSWALVVGINRYRKRSLRLSYAVNDARSIVSALRKVGFSQNRITLLEDGQATGLAVRQAFDRLRLNTKPEDRVFIFFAGHGTTVDIPGGGQMGYLIPVEGTVEALLATGIPMNQVRNMARLIPAKHVFFAIDACFAGLMAARETPKRYKAETVARLTRGRLRQVLTAGDRDQRAWEEAGHGLFTRRLLEGLDGEADVSPKDGVLTAMELAAYVQGQVTAITQGKQTPIFAKMEGVGQFVFTAPGIESRRTDGPPPVPVTVKPRPLVQPPVASIPKADLYVSSDPIGARVFIDGRDTGKETPVLLEGISTGDRRVNTRKGDYMVASTTVSVRRGVINRAKLKLEVLKGRLKVVSDPLEADVFVGKERVGRTPLIASVPGGARVIRVVKPGYKKFERKMNISVRRSNRLMAVLSVAPIPPGMVKVPAGWFVMGSERGNNDEKPRRRVYLDAFYIDKYPVTNSRFRRFGRPDYDAGAKFNEARQPVVGVTWFQARDYCASVGKRLPTEAEREKAARGVDGRKYPWGNQWDGSKMIWRENSGKRTHAVDRTYNTHRSPYGAVDLVGNTWEWVADWYRKDYYRNAPNRNPKGPSLGNRRVVRGGSWGAYKNIYGKSWLRATTRNWQQAHSRYNFLSFRCAKAP